MKVFLLTVDNIWAIRAETFEEACDILMSDFPGRGVELEFIEEHEAISEEEWDNEGS